MGTEKHEQLVRRLEQIDARSPATYRLLVGGVAVGGYVFYTVVILGTGAMMGFLCSVIAASFNVWILYAIIGLLIVVWSFLRSLWVKFPTPTGISIVEEQSPTLFRDVREISSRIGGPRVHQILVTGDFNASLTQVPRLGVFGWQKNYLSVGLPLLAALSHDEFRAVLAHEFGHLAGFHGRFGGWVYRVRQTWVQGATALAEQRNRRTRGIQAVIVSVTSSVTLAFLKWYVPLLDACSFVLRRRQEYEADAFAAKLFGAQTMVRALANMEVRSETLAEFWNNVWTKTRELAEPPANFYGALAGVTRTAVAPQGMKVALANAAQEKTGYADSHPCLRDRAAALGITLDENGFHRDIGIGEPVVVTAWQQYLGESPNGIVASVEGAWRQTAMDNWKSQFKEFEATTQKRAALAAVPVPTNEQLLELGNCTLRLEGAGAALPIFEKLLRCDPQNRAGKFQLAQIYLQQNRPEGEPIMLEAIAGSIDFTRAGLLALHSSHVRSGSTERAEAYVKRLREFENELQRARAERNGCTSHDTFVPAEPSSETLQQMRTLFAEYVRLDRVFLVKKFVRHLPEHPYFIVGLKPRRHWWGGWNASETAELMQIAKWINLPGQGWVVILNSKKQQLARSLRAVPSSEVYSRSTR